MKPDQRTADLITAAIASAQERAANPDAVLIIDGERRYTAPELEQLHRASRLTAELGEFAPAALELLRAVEWISRCSPPALAVHHPYPVPFDRVEYVAPPGVKLSVIGPLPENPHIYSILTDG